MPNTNSSYAPLSRSQRFESLIQMLERMTIRHPDDASALQQFDTEAEKLIAETFGPADERLEAYHYAVVGDAEHIVNLPESAQETAAQDVPKKAIQQRRQVLEGCLAELTEGESIEAQVLTGEDAEDPPSKS